MPEATKFSTRAKRNGFPFCLDKVDVSDFDYWVTLGGTQKGSSPSSGEIGLSLENASRLFWNVYALNYSLSFSGSGDDSGSVNVVDDDSNFYDPAPEVTPKSRLCPNNFESTTLETSEGNGVAFGYPSTDFFVGFRSTESVSPIIRMYDGVTTNESNFVGYGVRSNYLDFLSAGDFPEPPDTGIFAPFVDDASGLPQYMVLQSYFNEIDAANDDRFIADPDESSYGYTNLPIVGSEDTISFASAFVYYGSGTVVLNAEERSAFEESTPFNNETVIDSIEFYTY